MRGQAQWDGLLGKRLDALTRDAEGIFHGDVGALHRTRVASRRLRELVPILPMDGEKARTLRRRLKKFTRELGVVRELDVLMILIQELRRNPRCSKGGLRLVGTEVQKAQATAHDRLVSRFPL